MEKQNQSTAADPNRLIDARLRPRFKVVVDIRIDSKTCGVIKGHTVDISETGLSAILRLEVPLGEVVELQFTLPFGSVRVYATVRQHSAFRYGFQFVESDSVRQIIQTTCRSLALEQSLSG